MTSAVPARRPISLRLTLALLGMAAAPGSRAEVVFDSASGDVGAAFDNSGNNLTLLGSSTATFTGGISGTGSLTKTGSGTWRLEGNNSYTGGTFVNEGTLALTTASSASVHAIAGGSLVVGGGGFVELGGSGGDLLGATTDLVLDGYFDLHGRSETFDEIWGSGIVMNAVSGTTVTLTVGQSGGSSTFSGTLQNGAGVLSLAKIGSGTVTLSHANSYSGGTRLDAGTLAVANDLALGSGTLTLNGGTLQPVGARTIANGVSLLAASTIGGTDALTLGGAFVLNGFKSLTIANSAAGGVTIAGPVTQSRPSTLIKEGSGELQLKGASSYSGGTLIGAGTVRINNLSGSAFGSGAVTVASGGTLTGGGSFTGPLVLNGLISPGDAPGTLTSGSETWNGGAGLVWKINSVAGAAGADPGWGLLAINGALTLRATPANPFTIYLASLTPEDAPGMLEDFDRFTSYSFVFAATDGITGFDPAAFAIVTDGFANSFAGGSWAVVQTGVGLTDLSLAYTGAAIPEASAFALWTGVVALAWGLIVVRRRRRITFADSAS